MGCAGGLKLRALDVRGHTPEEHWSCLVRPSGRARAAGDLAMLRTQWWLVHTGALSGLPGVLKSAWLSSLNLEGSCSRKGMRLDGRHDRACSPR